eukprot:TRINITY_DN5866_c0_g1_i1.p1 TRINITY_DN5866_c0_g1~~TRINITY_DN5866_c0_g1_i1.p1  ORF type:complete len:334 (-),score=107.79 TRINITY_DN5866_c0_g1_i1:33-1034(-)
MGKNFTRGSFSRDERKIAVEKLVEMISNTTLPLESLKIEGSSGNDKLKFDILPFLVALGSNTKLTSLDISGHGFGVRGALYLSRAIQTNRTLKTLVWDYNLSNLDGLEAVSQGLGRNDTLHDFPLPWSDVAASTPSSSDEKERRRRGESVNDLHQTRATNYKLEVQQLATLKQNRLVFDVDSLPSKFKSKKLRPEQLAILTDLEHHNSIIASLNELKSGVGAQLEDRLTNQMKTLGTNLYPMINSYQNQAAQSLVGFVAQSINPAMGAEILPDLESKVRGECKELTMSILSRILTEKVGLGISSECSENSTTMVQMISDSLTDALLAKLEAKK